MGNIITNIRPDEYVGRCAKCRKPVHRSTLGAVHPQRGVMCRGCARLLRGDGHG